MKITEIEHKESVKPAMNFSTYNIEVTMKASVDDDDDIDEAKKRLQEEARNYIDAVSSQALPVFIKMCADLEKAKRNI